MQTVLWISRHPMTHAQSADLGRIVGQPYQLVQWDETVTTVDELTAVMAQADWIAAVLPTSLLAQVVRCAGSTPVIQARSQRQATGTLHIRPDGVEETQYRFVHDGWEQVMRLDLEVIRL